jgi:hypothetical protein
MSYTALSTPGNIEQPQIEAAISRNPIQNADSFQLENDG